MPDALDLGKSVTELGGYDPRYGAGDGAGLSVLLSLLLLLLSSLLLLLLLLLPCPPGVGGRSEGLVKGSGSEVLMSGTHETLSDHSGIYMVAFYPYS